MRASAKKAAAVRTANRHFDKMTWDEKRHLCEQVFGGKTPDGKRQGVYISWHQAKGEWIWKYTVKGQVNAGATTPVDGMALDEYYQENPLAYDDTYETGDKETLTKSGTYSPIPSQSKVDHYRLHLHRIP
jgi:hypothetical protein